jgi:hypothetical protein
LNLGEAEGGVASQGDPASSVRRQSEPAGGTLRAR